MVTEINLQMQAVVIESIEPASQRKVPFNDRLLIGLCMSCFLMFMVKWIVFSVEPITDRPKRANAMIHQAVDQSHSLSRHCLGNGGHDHPVFGSD
jgi:cytochrome c oxidase assembly factor CtaG